MCVWPRLHHWPFFIQRITKERRHTEFPAFDPYDSAVELGGQVRCEWAFRSLILACSGRSPDLACWLDNREDGHNVSLVFKWRHGTEKKLPTEWCLILWWWGLIGVKVHLHLTETCGKSQAGCPHILPAAPHPSRSNPKSEKQVVLCYKGWGHCLQGGRPTKRTKSDKDIGVTSHIMLSVVKKAINTYWLNVLQLLKGA